MPRLGDIRVAAALAAGVLLAAPTAHAAGRPAVAALQVTLRHHHVYRGPVDGIIGGTTTAAVIRFQRKHGLTPDGVVGPKTRRAFGRFAKHVLGSRPLAPGMTGWDVAELQFALAWHGFPNAAIDGGSARRSRSVRSRSSGRCRRRSTAPLARAAQVSIRESTCRRRPAHRSVRPG